MYSIDKEYILLHFEKDVRNYTEFLAEKVIHIISTSLLA
jgi:hypothetical protein